MEITNFALIFYPTDNKKKIYKIGLTYVTQQLKLVLLSGKKDFINNISVFYEFYDYFEKPLFDNNDNR